jgi:hypothetical protein
MVVGTLAKKVLDSVRTLKTHPSSAATMSRLEALAKQLAESVLEQDGCWIWPVTATGPAESSKSETTIY